MALQDYGSLSYTMHHHSQLGMYIVRPFIVGPVLGMYLQVLCV